MYKINQVKQNISSQTYSTSTTGRVSDSPFEFEVGTVDFHELEFPVRFFLGPDAKEPFIEINSDGIAVDGKTDLTNEEIGLAFKVIVNELK